MTPSTTQDWPDSEPAPLSRRKFIGAATGGIVSISLVARGVPVELSHATTAELSARLSTMDRETFERSRGETFQFTQPMAAPISLQLTGVEDRSQGSGHGGECFAVLFRGPQDRPLSQGTYEVWNRRSGAFALFVVPMRADGPAPTYEALFNRLPA